jgi:hypothetical protein
MSEPRRSPADDQDTTDERVVVPLDDAIARLCIEDGRVHTFRSSAIAVIGAHWDLEDLVAAMRTYGIEESGPEATGMRHGLVLIDKHGPVFIATRSAAQPPAPPTTGEGTVDDGN